MTGIPNNGAQRGHTQPSSSSRPNSNGAGSYGLSIRVQGIDGHPYVVLNNQDRGPQSGTDPNTNGYIDTEGSFIENYEEYDFRGGKEAASNSPFMEFRSQNIMHYGVSQSGDPESQGRKPSTLLNFQKHPEILQPYDPETNSLNLDGFRRPRAKPLSLAEKGNQSLSSKSAVSASNHVKSLSLDRNKALVPQEKRPVLPQSGTALPKSKSQPQVLPPAQLTQPQTRMKLQLVEPQSKPNAPNPNPPQSGSKTQHRTVSPALSQPSTTIGPAGEKNKTSSRSPSSLSSTASSLDRSHREPDVLPLRRTDSSGPVLQSFSHSQRSSSSSSSKTLDGQMDVLYADTINRHANRRYIPFIPGSGRDIDTGSIPGVDELIEKFDGKDGSHQFRGRAGRRNRINPEDRKRSRSVDSGLSLRNSLSYSDGFNQQRGTSMEHVLRPSQLQLQKTAGNQDSWIMVVDGKPRSRSSSRTASTPGSPENTISNVGPSAAYKHPPTRSSSLPYKSEENKVGASSAITVLTTSLSTSSSKASSSTNKKPSSEADVQVKITAADCSSAQH